MPDLILLSPCAYRDASPAALMVESAAHYGLSVKLFGVGEPSNQSMPHCAEAQVKKLYDLMQKEKLADSVLVTDCRDVLFLCGETEIMAKFRSFHARLVMSCSKDCWPIECHEFTCYSGENTHGYSYLCAGQFIAEWDYTLHCLRHLLDHYRFQCEGPDNSQGWWMHAKMRGELEFAADTQCQLFQTVSGGGGADIEVIGHRVRNLLTGSLPSSLHLNGHQNEFAPHAELYRRLFA